MAGKGAPPGNQYAQKDETPKETFLHIRCSRIEKALWCKAAYPGKLADFVRDALNDAAALRIASDKPGDA